VVVVVVVVDGVGVVVVLPVVGVVVVVEVVVLDDVGVDDVDDVGFDGEEDSGVPSGGRPVSESVLSPVHPTIKRQISTPRLGSFIVAPVPRAVICKGGATGTARKGAFVRLYDPAKGPADGFAATWAVQSVFYSSSHQVPAASMPSLIFHPTERS
jgi:hypothetical protein